MNMNQEGNRPKLKKIKRPINRTAPMNDYVNPMQKNEFSQEVEVNVQNQNKSQSQSQSQSQPQSLLITPKPQAKIFNSKEINEYLDGEIKNSDVDDKKDNNIPNYITEEDYYGKDTQDNPAWLNLKVFISSILAVLLLGILVGRLFFSQSSVVHNGLQGVVVNSEVPRGRARCGIAERTQGCVLYVMNPQRQEMAAKDFYDIASQMTGRQRFMIETGNMRYANSKIKPGEIVQLNIPPL